MRITVDSLKSGAEVSLTGGSLRHPLQPDDRMQDKNHMFVSLEHCGISYQAPPDGLIADLWRSLDLKRLGSDRRHVRQLQILTPFHVTENTPYVTPPHHFPHTRWQHSLGAAALVDAMAANNGLPPETTKTGLALEATHDMMLPAGGDMTKQYFKRHERKLVDEDAQYGTIFDRQPDIWYGLCQRHGLPTDAASQMIASINGAGLLGQLHKLADASSYLSLDMAHMCQGFQRVWGEEWPAKCPEQYHEIFDLLRLRPLAIWETVEVRNGTAVVTDPWRLRAFLKVHLLMWRFYQNPAAKFLELLHLEVLLPYLARRGFMDSTKIMHWDDTHLFRLIDKTMGLPGLSSNLQFLGTPPLAKSFASRRQALTFERQAYRDGSFTLVWCTGQSPTINTKTHLFHVPGPNGAPVTFEQAEPNEAILLKRIALAEQHEPRWFVFYIPRTLFTRRLTPALEEAWQQARTRWLKEA